MSLCDRLGIPYDRRSPGTVLVHRAAVEHVLRAAVADGSFVLGLDGFEIDGPYVVPRMDLIYDGSTAWHSVPAFDALRHFDEDVWVDITLAPSSDTVPSAD
jgi:hypothetical protein